MRLKRVIILEEDYSFHRLRLRSGRHSHSLTWQQNRIDNRFVRQLVRQIQLDLEFNSKLAQIDQQVLAEGGGRNNLNHPIEALTAIDSSWAGMQDRLADHKSR